jgi:homogentisate phytyltransferase/homogentisate geranylgeranyltransferase
MQVVWSRVATAAVHALLGALLWRRAQETDLGKSAAIYSCYMFLWKLFYAEYLLLPLFC